jgi:carbamoyl-phosphate synthase large subunit
MAIVIPTNYAHDEQTDGYKIRRMAVDMGTPLITNVQVTKVFARAIEKYTMETLPVLPWDAYRN